MKTPFVLVLILASLLILSCSKSEKKVPVRILLTDNPATYDEVNVHIKGIQVKMNNDDAGWTSIQSKDTIVNLLDLQNGITTVIAQDEIPEGILKEVRLILGNENYVVVNGQVSDLRTPSASSSGLKIKIDKKLQQTMNSFVLDFDAALSVKEENGDYVLMPVIKLK